MIGTLNTKVTFSKIISIMELEINQRDAQGIDMELSSSPEVETPAGTPSPEVRSKKEKRKTSTSSISSSSPGRSKTRNLMSRLGRRTGQTANPGTEEEEEVGKGWRSLRHAVKVTNAVTPKKKSTVTREDSFLKKFSTRQPYRVESNCNPVENHTENVSKHETKEKHRTVFRMDGNLMLYWTGLVTVAVLYNLWTCIAREAFREIHENHLFVWITCDIVCDIVYVLDIVCQFRTGYLDQGLMVFDSVKLAKNYISTKYFYLDLVCLFPLDFIQFFIGIHPMVRFPRFIKLYRTFRFLYMLESRTAYPNFFRVANLTHILFLGSHWFAAFYYLISEAEDFKGDWSYPKPIGEFSSVTRKYLASLFWSTLTLTTIGDLPPPETNWEYVFVIVSYLIGVFIFATIVGQVGNVITNRNASRQEFERLLDGAKLYMRMHNVPPQLQKRVQRWYDYVWKRGRMKGSDINSLGMLPDKFKTELAIHVNLETLKKVTIFQECQPEFLHDLVLKMRAYIFTPGDLICRRGEVAREMFIIADGLVEIISETGTILTQMGTGDFFGEIGILNLDAGINRRTADVKSVGYSELFGLSREDVLEALKDHPEAEQIIRCYGQRRLKEIEKDRKQTKQLANANLSPGHLWSPNSPCKGLRAIITASQKASPNKQGGLPGIRVSNFDEENENRLNGKSKFVNSVKRLVGKRSRRKSYKSQHKIHQTSLVHPVENSHSTPMYPGYDTETNLSANVRGNPNGTLVCEAIENDSSNKTLGVGSAELLTQSLSVNPNDLCQRQSSSEHNTNVATIGIVEECGMCSRTNSQKIQAGDSLSSTNVISADLLSPVSNTNTQNLLMQGNPTPQQPVTMSTNSHENCADTVTNPNSENSSSGLYQPPYRNYIRVLQGTSKWPESFTLPDKITNIEEEHSPCGSPRICSRRTSVGSATPDSRATCCCYKLRHHFNDMEHKLGNMEEVYKNTLKMLSAISEQQILMMKEMSKPKTVLMEDSIDQNDPYLEITRL
ncbi:cyclic nucleotide-gated channel rod photoreceptor subunit alpha-like isoform X2 [Mizuhopecten yessoensis]|uniref:cyclic nucleotide-gated channel rod photoreceptor subunit alpha-like isoform X2 n=1 Tax=Mizuhopecten yessoensis TaxID=6573 RepID=UPI000B459D9F|nr:cyclic nucleotide-gated channel rod photoreceptor subunit alpha-like isoform X2 [Mizuhopecten yessoensis]